MKWIILLFGLNITFISFSQPEFAPVGAEWTYELSTEQWHPPFNKYYDLYFVRVSNDTIINGSTYKVVTRTSNTNFFGTGSKETMFLRQEGGKIYVLRDKEYLLYNFDASINETYTVTTISFGMPRNFDLRILDITYDTLNGQSYIIQKLDHPCFVSLDTLYAHQKYGIITYNTDLFYPEYLCLVDPPYEIKLRCYHEGNVLIKNFDSIPCDSLRPDIIRIATKENSFSQNISVNYSNENLQVLNNSEEPITEISLFNSEAKLIYQSNFENNNKYVEINIGEIPTGIYIYSIQLKNNKYAKGKIPILK